MSRGREELKLVPVGCLTRRAMPANKSHVCAYCVIPPPPPPPSYSPLPSPLLATLLVFLAALNHVCIQFSCFLEDTADEAFSVI